MKKFLTLAVIMLLAASYSMDISRNRVIGILGLGYGMTDGPDPADPTKEVPYNTMGLSIPEVNYEFEGKPSDMFKLYIYGGVAYYMDKVTVDGEDAEGWGGSTIDFNLNPMGKIYLPNNLFVKIGLPFEYTNYTSDADGAEAVPAMDMNVNAAFGFDNRKVYVHGLTPWDDFEEGICTYAFYDMGLMYSVDGEAAEELESFFGVAASYAHYADAMMIKPWLKYKKGMNDLVDENGYVNIGLDFVKDINEQINLQAHLDFGMTMLPDEDAAGNSSYNTLYVDAMGMYYVMPELAIGAGAGFSQDLTTEDANPVIMIMAGAEYTFDLMAK